MLSQSRIEAIKRAAFNHGEKQGMAQPVSITLVPVFLFP